MRELREHLSDASSLGRELVRQGVHVLTETLLKTVQSIYFVLGAAARFVDDLSRALLRRAREFVRLGLGFLLRLFDEALRHGDHRRHLLSSAAPTRTNSGCRRRRGCTGRDGNRGGSAACVQLTDALGRLAKLLPLLVRKILELANLDRESLEKLVDLVDVVALETDLEGHRVNGVERRECVVRAVHAATLPLEARREGELRIAK